MNEVTEIARVFREVVEGTGEALFSVYLLVVTVYYPAVAVFSITIKFFKGKWRAKR